VQQYKSFVLLTFTILLSGCQLPSANYFRDNVVPEDNTTKILLSPVLLPSYATLCVLDIALVNPIRGTQNVPSVSKAIWLWQNDPAWLGWGLLSPVKVAATPPAAVGTMIFSEQFVYRE
jgi:hypothetical protein